ncbi:UNVERIFIED_CONTAM: hypothetical protein NCL1_13428 [Trichonephila clavipes]
MAPCVNQTRHLNKRLPIKSTKSVPTILKPHENFYQLHRVTRAKSDLGPNGGQFKSLCLKTAIRHEYFTR